MYNYLVKHATDNIWCNNEQDNQLIIAGHKITKDVGVLNTFKLMNRYIKLPESGIKYHVYQIGQVNPLLLGLYPRNPEWLTEQWITFSYAINNLKLFANIYTTSGIELPRFKCYYMFTSDRDLIVAVPELRQIPIDFYHEQIYLRLYTNAYFQTLASDQLQDYIYCKGRIILNNDDINSMRSEQLSYQAKPGYVSCYCNGFKIDKFDLVNVAIGDIVELIYDSSVKKVVTFTVTNLDTFNSTLDSRYKYLLHYPNDTDRIIDYQDDIDIHVLYHHTDDRYRGHYYHRNSIESIRMVTHKDYSIPVDYYAYTANALKTRLERPELDIRTFKIELKIRKSGYNRPLIFDHNRIFELYKLPDSKVSQAMVGINATVNEWKAEVLEHSFYTALMRSEYKDIDMGLIQKAYGYNSISTILGQTPSKPYLAGTAKKIQVPYGLYRNSTAYEYDANGYLIGYYYHAEGTEYICHNTNCELVELISGGGSQRPNVVFGQTDLPVPAYYNYRVYMCYLVDGVPNNNWTDITDSALYHVDNGQLIWNDLEVNQFLMIRSDDSFLTYELNFPSVGGNIFFTLSEFENRGDGEQHYILPVPLGELDIFLNGKSLIRNLDYVVKFPMVYIINKKYLIQPAGSSIQHIVVRYTGFCKPDLSMDDIEDYGFIEHGLLSNNYRYDIRDDKVMRITVDGAVKHRNDLVFSELHSGVSIVNPINGKPYQVKDIIVPLKELADENTYSLRHQSMIVDQHISDYMTINLPQPNRDAPSAIPELYPVVSPFLARIITDMWNDIIKDSDLESNLSDHDILTICHDYEYLLDFDPIHNRLNSRYTIIHPHNLYNTISLSLYKYKFLQRVIKLYCDGLVNISNFITIS